MPYIVLVLATLTRFIPHAPNFSPVYGALLFGGANLRKSDSIWFPAITLGASDILLTKFIYHRSLAWFELIQLAAFVSVAMVGWVLQKRFSIGRLTFACLAAPTAFYVISDFGVWLEPGFYPHTWQGLVACYAAAIPFQGRVTASTVVFCAILFGAQQIHASRVQRRKHSQALAR